MNLRKRALVGSPSTEATDREIENRKLVREAAAESFVLLKNENNLLPLEKGTKLGLYGAGANVVNFSRYVNLENIFYAYVTHIVY